MTDYWKLQNTIYNTEEFKQVLKGLKTEQVFWVENDYTFYKIFMLVSSMGIKIKINVYEFKCVGFKAQKAIFKQASFKNIVTTKLTSTEYCYTYGAYALKLLKTQFNDGSITPTILTNGVKRCLRQAYAGGRNEYIQEPSKNAKLYSIDFNQMYFNCLKSSYLSGEIQKYKTNIIQEPGFYSISYESKDMKYPVLHVKNKINEQLYFCNGVGEGVFWYEEILEFIGAGGTIHKIHHAYKGAQYTKNFLPYVKILEGFENKKLIKLLANNLYGKLAMKDYIYEYRVLDELEFQLQNSRGRVGKWKPWYDLYICEALDYTKYSDYTDIAAAAAITAKARIKLHRLIQQLDGRVKICLINTDELIVEADSPFIEVVDFDVKIKSLNYETYEAKKKMFASKRRVEKGGVTQPYKVVNGMLL